MSLSVTGNTKRASWFGFINVAAGSKSARMKNKGNGPQESVVDQELIPFFSKRRSFVVRDVRHVTGNSISRNTALHNLPSPLPVTKQQDEHQQQWTYHKHKSEVLCDYGVEEADKQDTSSSPSTTTLCEARSVSTTTLHGAAQYTCKICTNFGPVPTKTMACGHIFHENCIRGWDEQCPICTVH